MHNNISKQVPYDEFMARNNINFKDFGESVLLETFQDVVSHEFQLIHLDDFKGINKILCNMFNTKVLDNYMWNEPLNLNELAKYVSIKRILIHIFDNDLIRACELLDTKQRIKFLNNKFTSYKKGETIRW